MSQSERFAHSCEARNGTGRRSGSLTSTPPGDSKEGGERGLYASHEGLERKEVEAVGGGWKPGEG